MCTPEVAAPAVPWRPSCLGRRFGEHFTISGNANRHLSIFSSVATSGLHIDLLPTYASSTFANELDKDLAEPVAGNFRPSVMPAKSQHFSEPSAWPFFQTALRKTNAEDGSGLLTVVRCRIYVGPHGGPADSLQFGVVRGSLLRLVCLCGQRR